MEGLSWWTELCPRNRCWRRLHRKERCNKGFVLENTVLILNSIIRILICEKFPVRMFLVIVLGEEKVFFFYCEVFELAFWSPLSICRGMMDIQNEDCVLPTCSFCYWKIYSCITLSVLLIFMRKNKYMFLPISST